LPRELLRLKTLVEKALAEANTDWAELRTAYAWVHQAAHLLNNKADLDVLLLRREFRQLLAQMSPLRKQPGLLGQAATQFWKVTKSYWQGLFACYEMSDLPRTNNALEQQFGAYRHHERRCTGRKVTSPMTVIRGSVRLVAALSTPSRGFEGADLRPRCLAAWQRLRQDLQHRHTERAVQRRFRKDPKAYLADLEERLLKATLPT
jgi:hypothetical protein